MFSSSGFKKQRNTAFAFALVIVGGVLGLIGTMVISQQKVQTQTKAATTSYLTREGARLILHGQDYKFTGFNVFGFTGCEGISYSDADINAYFSLLQPYSMTRTWAFEYWGFERLDAVVKSAEVNKQLLILTLADGRSHCNESDGAVGGDGSGKIASWYQDGYKVKYIPWIKTVVERYKSSPAIGMWELINEPGASGVTDQTMKAFFDEASLTIKSIDPNHLVATGAQAEYVEGTNDYAYVHGSPNIDVGTLHEYDYDYQNSNVIVSGHFTPTYNGMTSLNKPLIIEEVGVKGANRKCRTSLATRSDVFRQKFDSYFSLGATGVIAWNWSKANHTSECDYWVGFSDPMMSMMRSYPRPGISGIPSITPIASSTPMLTLTPTTIQTPTPTVQANLLTNPSFDVVSNWPSPWIFTTSHRAKGNISRSSTRVDGAYAAQITVNKTDSNSNAVQLSQRNLSLVSNRIYTITFWAKANNTRPLGVTVQKATSPSMVYVTQSITVTNAWKQYAMTFVLPQNESNAALIFGAAQSKESLWLDNVSLR